MIDLLSILQQQQLPFSQHNGVYVSKVLTMYEGFKIARQVLHTVVDKTTVFYLSGGKTPKGLYENLANDKKIQPGAVALVDERYGLKGHNSSNERMISESGFLSYIQEQNIPFYPVLQPTHQSLKETSDNYDMTIRYLFAGFPRSVATLGIGDDGHTAGIAPDREGTPSYPPFKNVMFDDDQKNLLVSSYSDLQGPYKERISMTYLGLSMIDTFIVLVFGEDKKDALLKVFADGPEEEVPARFLRRPEIGRRTLLITDQKV